MLKVSRKASWTNYHDYDGYRFQVAFGIRNLKWSTIIRLQQRHELNLRHNNSSLAEMASSQNLKQLLASHHYIDVRLNSNILTQNQVRHSD